MFGYLQGIWQVAWVVVTIRSPLARGLSLTVLAAQRSNSFFEPANKRWSANGEQIGTHGGGLLNLLILDHTRLP